MVERATNGDPPSSRSRLDLLFRVLGVLVLLASFGGGWLIMSYRSFVETPLSVPAKGMVYNVSSGTSLHELAQDLARRGIVSHPRFLVWMGRDAGYASRIQAGEYRLTPQMRPADLLRMLVDGRVIQHSLTLVEGWTFREVMAAVRADPDLTHTLQGLHGEQIMARLGHPGEAPEGRFYPDTYYFPRGTTDVAFLQRAYRMMARRLKAEWQQRAPGLPLKSPYQALILASIVEKETAVESERPRIAGVFIRRLRLGMRLQTDPTVIFGLGPDFKGRLHASDLRKDTPYNTYTRYGLPPTPIALPSGESIHAALHPAAGDSLYFVARGDGHHHFSRTLAQHDAAVRRYQLHEDVKVPKEAKGGGSR
ncbi:MAG: endolytic transglycosylase MltG [Gammaproteobacteria bacterium]